MSDEMILNIDSGSDSGQSKMGGESATLQYYRNLGYLSVKTDITEDELLNHAYNGTRGFRNGAYVTPFPIERNLYKFRQEVSVYNPILKKIIDAGFVPASNGCKKRESKNDIVNAFLGDVDNGGLGDMQSFMYEVACNLRLYSYAMILMSPNSVDSSAVSEGEMVENRLYPYARLIDPLHIVDESDVADDFGRLEELTICDGEFEANGKEYDAYLTIDKEFYTRWYYSRASRKSKVIIGEPVPVPEKGKIPIVAERIGAQKCAEYWRPNRTMVNLSMLAWRMYNIDSMGYDTLQKCGMPVLMIEGIMSGNFAIGAGAALTHATGTAHPKFEGINPELIRMHTELKNELMRDMLEVADQNGVSAQAQNGTASGIAHAYMFRGQNEALRQIAKRLQKIETAMVSNVCAWTNTNNDYIVQYDDDFYTESEFSLKDLLLTKDYTLIPLNQRRVEELIARDLWGDEYDSVSADIADELDAMNTDTVSVAHI